jgi:hypothetical protein
MRKGRGLVAPAFRTEEEEIAFWDTHDVEDYLTGEQVPIDALLRPPPTHHDASLVTKVLLQGSIEDAKPAALYFMTLLSPYERERDLRMVVEEQLAAHRIDHYGVRYTSAVGHAGASPGPVRELVVDMVVGREGAVQEALTLIKGALDAAPGEPPVASRRRPSAASLSPSRQAAIMALGRWLREHHAVAITAAQAHALLHP